MAPAAVAPIASIVVICEVPMLSTGVMQERVATPSRCTVQAPQSAMPQPNFVPVMPSTSRNTHKRGVSVSTSTVRSTPLTLIVVAITTSRLDRCSIGCSSTHEWISTREPEDYPDRSHPAAQRRSFVWQQPQLPDYCDRLDAA